MTSEAMQHVLTVVEELESQDSPDDASQQEAQFELILAIASNPENRMEVSALFQSMLAGERSAPEWLIAYCMRDLRWPEIEALAHQVSGHSDFELRLLASECLEAYQPRWDGDLIFSRYSKGKKTS